MPAHPSPSSTPSAAARLWRVIAPRISAGGAQPALFGPAAASGLGQPRRCPLFTPMSMNKLIPKKQWRYLIVGAVLLVAAGAVALRRRWSPVSQPALNTMLQQVRSEPGAWPSSERDVSVLLQDMQTHSVAGLALAPSGMFVSTRAGARYFVGDSAGKLAGLVLASYEKTETVPFPLAVVGEDLADSTGVHLDLGLVLTIGFMSVVAIQGVRVYRGNGFQFSKNQSAVTFEDVIGASEAKAALMDIKSYLKDPV